MIIIHIKGGLGNQMFQYAYGRCLMLDGHDVMFNISAYHVSTTKDTPRTFLLEKFVLSPDVQFVSSTNVISRLLSKLARHLGVSQEEYFQSENYFKNHADSIRNEFVLKKPLSDGAKKTLDDIQSIRSTAAIHVRRGDYVTNKKINSYHGVCDMSYYTRAMNYLEKNKKIDKYFVFSDDIAWAKKQFIGDKFVFVSDANILDVEEMYLMSQCQHNIIANSTFSWWGAWLNTSHDKIVIAPKTWFNNSIQNNKQHIVPDTWISL